MGDVNKAIETDALQDNTGINISDKNEHYGELTGYYWVLNNFLNATKSEYIGFCQPYRFLDFNIDGKSLLPFRPIFIANFVKSFMKSTDENVLAQIQDFAVVLPQKTNVEKTVYDEWMKDVDKEDFDLALSVIREISPDYSTAIDEFIASDSMYLFGSFVMKTELMTEFLSWMFDIF